MEILYGLITYTAVLFVLGGCILRKVSDILEKKRIKKYYEMIKNDAAFWQMKIEQTGMNITAWVIDEVTNKIEEKKIEKAIESNEQKEGNNKSKIMFDEFEGMNDEIII